MLLYKIYYVLCLFIYFCRLQNEQKLCMIDGIIFFDNFSGIKYLIIVRVMLSVITPLCYSGDEVRSWEFFGSWMVCENWKVLPSTLHQYLITNAVEILKILDKYYWQISTRHIFTYKIKNIFINFLNFNAWVSVQNLFIL